MKKYKFSKYTFSEKEMGHLLKRTFTEGMLKAMAEVGADLKADVIDRNFENFIRGWHPELQGKFNA